MTRPRFVLGALAAALFSLFGFTSTAHAVPIVSISGTYLVGPGGPPGSFPNGTFSSGLVGSLSDGGFYTPSSLGQLTTTNMNVNPIGFTSLGGPLTMAVSAGGSQTFTITVNSGASLIGVPTITPTLGGTAVFSILNPGSLSSHVAPSPPDQNGSGRIDVQMMLTSNSSGINLGAIGGIWNFALTYNGNMDIVPGSPNGTIIVVSPSSGGGGTSSASFSLTAANAVPEPASLATLGLLGFVGGYVARRKLKLKAQPVPA